MSPNSNALQNIPNGKPVRIFLPLQNGPDRIRAQGVYQATSPPRFSLLFKPGILPIDHIDARKSCIVTIDMGGPTISLEAMIENVANPQTLQMIVQKSISHKQMREFFRVDAVTRVICSSFHTQFTDQDSQPWSLQGQTMDFSGAGILASFSEEPPADKQVHLEITVPLAVRKPSKCSPTRFASSGMAMADTKWPITSTTFRRKTAIKSSAAVWCCNENSCA